MLGKGLREGGVLKMAQRSGLSGKQSPLGAGKRSRFLFNVTGTCAGQGGSRLRVLLCSVCVLCWVSPTFLGSRLFSLFFRSQAGASAALLGPGEALVVGSAPIGRFSSGVASFRRGLFWRLGRSSWASSFPAA